MLSQSGECSGRIVQLLRFISLAQATIGYNHRYRFSIPMYGRTSSHKFQGFEVAYRLLLLDKETAQTKRRES